MSGPRTDDRPELSAEELADYAAHLDAVTDGRGDESLQPTEEESA